MDDPWTSLRSAATKAMGPLWYDFAKEGRESAVLAPLGRYPSAAARLAESMGSDTDYIPRKLGAMLAGWVQHPAHVDILPGMLDRERTLFCGDSISANSVGEDIMFAATRWTASSNSQVRNSGIAVLANMVSDALKGTPWNTVHWAAANLYQATGGNHPILDRLISISDMELSGQTFFANVVRALCRKDGSVRRFVTPPTEQSSLSGDEPHYSMMSALWEAAAELEAQTPM